MSGMYLFLGFSCNNVAAFTYVLYNLQCMINVKYITFMQLKEEIYFICVFLEISPIKMVGQAF